MKDNIQLLQEVTAFLNFEADLLDHKEYDEWLKLWTETGIYIVPTDHDNKDYKNSLNVAYDNAKMRKLRVQRLQNGEAISTINSNNTVRTLSRFRIISVEDNLISVRCAYSLFEYKKNDLRIFPADITFKLLHSDNSFKIEEKVAKIMQSNEHLTTISYLF